MAKIPEHRDPELIPDAWERFDRAVDAVVKGGPQHRSANKPVKPPLGNSPGESQGGDKVHEEAKK